MNSVHEEFFFCQFMKKQLILKNHKSSVAQTKLGKEVKRI